MQNREAARSAPPAAGNSSSSGNGGKGKRQIDDFLNEIINRQENMASSGDRDSVYGRGDRGEGAPAHTLSTTLDGGYIEKGSYDNGDPTTTNLYLGNISPATLGTLRAHVLRWTVPPCCISGGD